VYASASQATKRPTPLEATCVSPGVWTVRREYTTHVLKRGSAFTLKQEFLVLCEPPGHEGAGTKALIAEVCTIKKSDYDGLGI
jgi:hypothetical protein